MTPGQTVVIPETLPVVRLIFPEGAFRAKYGIQFILF